jgi:hypothetical protein
MWFQQFDGPANEFSAILGAPWVYRMAERLRSKSSNTLQFSFGHDVYLFDWIMKVTLLPVMTALGLFPERAFKPLGTKSIEWNREFRGGNIIPFCGNLVVEKIKCSDGRYVRILNNQIPGIRSLILWSSSSSRMRERPIRIHGWNLWDGSIFKSEYQEESGGIRR